MKPVKRIDEVKALLLYSEVYRQRPTPQLLKMLLGRANRWQYLNFICALSAIMHNTGMLAMTPAWQAGFLGELGSALGSRRAAELLQSSGQVLLSEVQLGLLARYSLQYCAEGETVGDLADIILRTFLIVNELHTASQKLPAGVPDRRAFFSIEAQSAVVPNERLAHVIQRYYRLFQWADDIPKGSEDWLPLRADFSRLMAMSPNEYLTAAFCVLSHYLAIHSAKNLPDHPPSFSLSQFGASLKNRTPLDAWVTRFSVSAVSLSGEKPEPTFTVADIAPFIERPLIRVGDDRYFCPLPSLLEDTLNTRLYFVLFAEYENNDGLQIARRFSGFQGHFLEDYVAKLVAQMITPGYELYREIRYMAPGGHRKSTDVVARRTSDGAAAFIEVTKTRFRLTESLFALDEQAVMKDIDSMVVRKAGQIQRRIDDLQAGLFAFPGPISVIAPVVVTGQGIPGLIYLKHRVEAELRAGSILQTTVPLLYCDIEELEGLALADPGNIDLFALLREKAEHVDPLARLQGLKNYLHYFREDLSRKKTPRETVFPEYDEAVKNAIEPTLRSWGLSMTFDREPL
jgi:hypothetical protein